MRPTPIKFFFISIMLIASTLSNLGLPVAYAAGRNPEQAQKEPANSTEKGKISPAGILNEDGSLNLNGSYSGTLDLEGWDVQMDPLRGPLFAPADQWSNVGNGLAGALNGDVFAVAVSGTDIYVGGNFTNAGGIATADRIAKWDGSNWSALGSNGAGGGSLNDDVFAIAVNGSNVYVGGAFDNVSNNGTTLSAADYVALWNGTAWSALGASAALGNGSQVNAIAVSGTDVYVGGNFTNAAGVGAADYIARWNGTAWSALGASAALGNQVNAIAINGSNVYVGGNFTNAAGIGAADYVALWNGTAWSALGASAALGNGSQVNAIAVSGTDVYVGGIFTNAGGTNTADYIARWNGTSWSALGSNGGGNGSIGGGGGTTVTALAISGSNVYVGGDFSNVNNNGTSLGAADDVALWNGTNWSALGSNGGGNGSLGFGVQVNAIAASGSNVYVGGDFTDVNNNGTTLGTADYISLWNGSAWSNLGSLSDGSLSDQINAIAISGTDVYVGGQFTDLDNNGTILGAADYIAKWDGTNWSALGSDGSGGGSLNNDVNAIAISGSNVYVGGQFDNVNNNGTTLTGADFIAVWNGTNWSALGASAALNNDVNAIAVSGSNVYVGGDFFNAAGINTADFIALWNGSTWSALGSSALNNTVNAIAINGSNVYVGGQFDNVAGINTADFIALWNGSAWSALGSTPLNNDVNAIAISGSNVYVGGAFTNAGGIGAADYIALWNGSAWSNLSSNGSGGGSISGGGGVAVNTIVITGIHVFVGGSFTNVNNNGTVLGAADRIARWNGSNWFALGSNGAGNGSLNDDVNAIALNSTDAYVGGLFDNVNNNGTVLNTADFIAEYGLPDVVSPSTTSFTRQTPASNPTNADSLVFRVTFNEAVTSVDMADFAVNGTTTATVSGVSPVSTSVYDVTVSNGDLASFNGVVGLNFSASPSITDLNFNPLPNTEPGTDETYTLDNVAPNTTSFIRQTPAASPTNADTLVFRATFSEAMSGVDTADFAVNGTTTATVSGVNPVSASVYDVTISGGDLASFNGVVGLDFSGGMNITDLAGNSLPNTEPGTDETYTVDNTAPTTTSFTLQTPATSPTNADTLVFRATFSEAVTGVNVADFAVNGTTTATVSGVSPVSASVYDVTVSGGDLASFNGVVGLDFSGGMDITDPAGNALSNTEPGTDETYTVDNTAPSTTSFTLQTPANSPTNADTLVFRATFSEDMSGVNTADFAVNGTTTATVTGVSPVSASVYDVTVSGGDLASFNGVVGLNFSGGMNITDLAGNSLTNTEPGTDETYTVDNTAPSTTSFTLQTPASSPTNADTLVFRATFSEDVTSVDTTDFAVNGTTTATVTGVSPVSASIYDITVSGGDLASFNGVVGLDFSGGMDITDPAGNALSNTEPGTDETYTVDNTAPSTTSFTLQTPATSPTNADTLVFRATFSEDMSGVNTADFAVNGTTTASVTNVSPVSASVYDVTISGGDLASFDGVVGLDFSGGMNITDLAGNSLPNTEPGTDQTYTVDNTAPTTTSFTLQTPATSPTNADTLVFRATFSEAVTGVNVADFAVNSATSATVTGINPVSASIYDITISGGDLASFNGVVGLDINASPSITDLVSNPLPNTEPGTDETYTLDNIAPTTTSFIRLTPANSLTNADTLVFRVAFSEAMSNVDVADFAINGTTTASVTNVNPVSASVYDVTVSGGDLASFNGVVGLDFSGGMDITDLAGNSLPNTEPGTDQTYTLDNTVPNVISFTLQTPATSPTNADTLIFRATFSEAVTGVDIADFAVNGTTTATVTNITPVTASVYDVTISGGDLASFNGVVGLDFSGSMNITDLTNAVPNTEPGTDETYTVDNTAPTTTSFTLQTPATSPTNADTLVFRVTFSEAVISVGVADFAVNGTTTAAITGVNPISTSIYDVTVSGGDLASFNGVVGLDFSGTMNITDLVGNVLSNTEPGTDETYTIDNTAPDITSFTRQTPATSPTNADTLVFRATFSEDVTGVDIADFAVNGTTTAAITGVNQVSANLYDVTVSGGDLASFNGVVGLNFSASLSIADLVGNTLPNTEPGTDQTYILENGSPSATSFTLQTPVSSPTNADTLVFRTTFSEDVTGVDVADFAVNGTTTATVTNVSTVSASIYDVTVSGGDLASFNGVVGLNLAASPSITDLIGNPLLNSEPGVDQTYTLDNTIPGVTINQASSQTDPTNISPINFTVVFNEAINLASFTGTDVTLGGTANPTTATISQIAPLDGTTFNVSVSGMNATGTVIALIQSGQVNDLAGNSNNASTSTDNSVNYVFSAAPVITEGASVNVVMSQNGSPIPFALTLHATDPNSDPLTWSIFSQGSNGVAGVVAGPASSTSVSYSPALNFFGADTFVVQVSDGSLTDTITVNVTITAVQMPAPVVLSIMRSDPNPTADIHVNYIVTFSSPVTGVDMSDFTVTMNGGVAGSAVIAVSGSGSVYTVTVNTGSNVGTIRLDVLDDNSIVDAFSTPLDGGFTSGEVYTIVRKSPIFADVPFSHWANSYIERLYNAGITGGCGTDPLIYCPSSMVTRAQMAVFIMKTINGPFYVPPSATGTVFNDVPSTHWAAAWIEQFRTLGLTAGCGNNNYCPEQVLTTRAQMAVFLLRAKYGAGYHPPVASGTVFNDVSADYWAAAWIEQLAADGITSGCGGGNYCPEAPLSRAEMAVFLVKTLYITKEP